MRFNAHTANDERKLHFCQEALVKKFLIAAIAAASLPMTATMPVAAQERMTPQAIAALNMTAVPDLDREDVRTVQRVLRDKAFDPGPIDGVAGPRTREAIRAFQARYGIKATGVIDNQLLFALGEAELAFSAR